MMSDTERLVIEDEIGEAIIELDAEDVFKRNDLTPDKSLSNHICLLEKNGFSACEILLALGIRTTDDLRAPMEAH